MKIGLQTWGTTGDIRPFIALAGGLSGAGHEVTLAYTDIANGNFDQWASRGGFRIERVGHVKLDESDVKQRIIDCRNPLLQLELILRSCLDPFADEMYAASCRLCGENDAVIAHGLVHHLQVAAEKQAKPCAVVMLQPNAAVSRFLPPATLPDLGRWGNTLSWKLAHLLVDRVLRHRINGLRQRVGLAPIAHALDGQVPRHPHLHAFSPTLRAGARDWGPMHRVCGYFVVPAQFEAWEIPADMHEFLRAGDAPVFIGFGSADAAASTVSALAETAELLVDAAALAGCRATVQLPWSKLGSVPERSGIYRLEQGLHSALFPHCSVVVHAGSAGTTHTATRAGRPSVVVAHWLDQFVWATRLKELGVAPRHLLRRRLTAVKLAKAIRLVRSDPRYLRRAGGLAAAMSSEMGIRTAVESIESWFHRG